MSLSAILSLLSLLQAAGKTLEDLYGYVKTLVKSAEADAAGATGPQKLLAVLAGVESYLGANGANISADWQAAKNEVSAIVAGLVSLWNFLGVFKKAPATTAVTE